MSNSQRTIARKKIKEMADNLVKVAKVSNKRKKDYIVRINVDTLHSVAVIRVPATSRKEAVELVKGAIELTGEVAPLTLPEQETEDVVVQEEKAE